MSHNGFPRVCVCSGLFPDMLFVSLPDAGFGFVRFTYIHGLVLYVALPDGLRGASVRQARGRGGMLGGRRVLWWTSTPATQSWLLPNVVLTF